jgi:glucose dehydrogenase
MRQSKPGPEAADWPVYTYDLAGTRHSPLRQINGDNVSSLSRAWTYAVARDKSAGTLTGGSEFTPIVVNGVMYVATGDRVVALEGETGSVT